MDIREETMDITPEYIKMCDKAVPDLLDYFMSNISELRPMFIYDTVIDRVGIICWAPKALRQKLGTGLDEIILSIEYENDRGLHIPEGVSKPVTPLWRQDQLQKMYADYFGLTEALNCAHAILDAFQFFALSDVPNVCLTYNMKSFEQLWLAFVMKEIHNKVWNGEDWVIKT